jgi:hypothetical protein
VTTAASSPARPRDGKPRLLPPIGRVSAASGSAVVVPPRLLLGLGAALLGGVVLLQTATTRGYVRGPGGYAVAGADVLLADEAGIRARTATDAQGYFRFLHPPLDRERHALLICAPGHGARVVRPAASAVARSVHELPPLSASAAFWTPARLGWEHPTPRSCPEDLGPFAPPA